MIVFRRDEDESIIVVDHSCSGFRLLALIARHPGRNRLVEQGKIIFSDLDDRIFGINTFLCVAQYHSATIFAFRPGRVLPVMIAILIMNHRQNDLAFCVSTLNQAMCFGGVCERNLMLHKYLEIPA